MISYFIQNVARKKQSLHNDIRKLDPEENVQSMQYDMCQIGIENRLMHILSFVLPFVFTWLSVFRELTFVDHQFPIVVITDPWIEIV